VASDFELTADTDRPQWIRVAGVSTARNYQNEQTPGPPNPAVETPRL